MINDINTFWSNAVKYAIENKETKKQFIKRLLYICNNSNIFKTWLLEHKFMDLNSSFDDDSIIQINPILNEYRIFDILEDLFQEDIIIHENQEDGIKCKN